MKFFKAITVKFSMKTIANIRTEREVRKYAARHIRRKTGGY